MFSARSIVDADEKIIFAVHRHWISLVLPLVSAILIGALALVGFYYLGAHLDALRAVGSLAFAALGLGALILLALVLAYSNIQIYLQNILILTDRSIYLVVKNSLVQRDIAQFSIDELEDALITQSGIWATILDYGDLTVETAGKRDNLVFQTAAHPQRLADVVMDAVHAQSHHEEE